MQQNNMLFLRKRIFEIGSALMSNESDAGYKFPTTIINALNVDENGNLYALLQQPERRFQQEDMVFPAQLKFYRKGKPFHMNVAGTAYLMNDVSLLNNLLNIEYSEKIANKQNAMVVKIKMEEIAYFEWKEDVNHGWVKKWYQWLTGINLFSLKLKLHPPAIKPNSPQYAH